jgi:hypothetical protein
VVTVPVLDVKNDHSAANSQRASGGVRGPLSDVSQTDTAGRLSRPGSLCAIVSQRRLATALGIVLTCALSGCGGSTVATRASSSAAGVTSAATASSVTTATSASVPPPAPRRHRHPRSAIPDVGSLPQTEQVPSARTRVFHAEMRALWSAVRSGSVTPGLPAFFPEAAYVRLKSIGSPQSDWEDRLVGDYRLDVEAAHALLGAGAARARLVDVQVPGGYAHWTGPGVCDNGIGYYELPNARVVYRAASETRSFGIASMISWHGLWFVVHLGAILRPTGGGVVDAPSVGPGVSEPSSTC